MYSFTIYLVLTFGVTLLIAIGLANLISKVKVSRWTTSFLALGFVVIARLVDGHWPHQFGGFEVSPWYIQIIEFAVTWIISAWIFRLLYILLCKIAPHPKEN